MRCEAVDMFGQRCPGDSVGQVTVGCVHEHIAANRGICSYHLDLFEAGEPQFCGVCWALGADLCDGMCPVQVISMERTMDVSTP